VVRLLEKVSPEQQMGRLLSHGADSFLVTRAKTHMQEVVWYVVRQVKVNVFTARK
jgi:hypothetical protein